MQVRGGKHKIDFPPVDCVRNCEPNNLSDRYRNGWEGYLDGGALTLEHFDRDHLPLGKLCQDLQALFYFVRANLYLSGPATQSFAVHADAGDIFAIQVSGRKQWTLYNRTASVEWPLFPHLRYGSLSKAELGQPIEQVTLEPGDLLYVPRGMAHEVRTLSNVSSIHFTISIASGSINWAELLKNRFSQLGPDSRFWDEIFSPSSSFPELRRALPPGLFLEPQGSGALSKAKEIWRTVASHILEASFADVENIVKTNAQNYAQQKREDINRRNRQPRQQIRLLLDSMVRRAQALVTKSTSDGVVIITDTNIRVCSRLTPLVMFVKESTVAFEVKQLPGQDPFAKFALVETLLDKHILELV